MMAVLPGTISVIPLHAAASIRNELRQMMNLSKPLLTLGSIMRLKLIDSPFIIGGKLTMEDIQEACSILGITQTNDVGTTVKLIEESIKTAFQIFDIINPTPGHASSTPCYASFSPEWVADLVSASCRAMPSLTYQQILWEVPFAFIAHLVAASHRANGGRTSRPFDIKDALNKLEQLNNQ